MSELYPSQNDDDSPNETDYPSTPQSTDDEEAKRAEEVDRQRLLSPEQITAENRRRRQRGLARPLVFGRFNSRRQPRHNSPDLSPATITRADRMEYNNNRIIRSSANTIDDMSSIGQSTISQMEQDGVNFIASNSFSGERVGMRWCWGPFGLGYYSNIPNNCIEMYRDKRNNFNNLSKEKREIYQKFLLEIFDYSEDDLVTFFGMLGLRKYAFSNINSMIALIVGDLCPVCFKLINIINKKKKCISFECEGMCQECNEKIKDTCPVCRKKQEIKCPICLEIRPVWASKILNCQHGICWSCYGSSLEMGRALITCPNCRKPI